MSNTLNQSDIVLFYKLYSSLLVYANSQKKIVDKLNSQDDFFKIPVEDRIEVRNTLFEHKEYIHQFLESKHSDGLSEEERAIVSSWTHAVEDKFFIFKHYKNYSIFLSNSDETKAFAVSGITDSIEDMFPHTPALAKTVLLPFKNLIIYDSLIRVFPITFGSGFCKNLKDDYEKAKYTFGIITQLPAHSSVVKNDDNDIEKLKFLMKNKSNREIHWNEIVNLSLKNKELCDFFYQEMGRVNSYYFSKQLKKVGIEKKWFAIIDNTVVASGATKHELQKNLKTVVPTDKVNRIYVFKT